MKVALEQDIILLDDDTHLGRVTLVVSLCGTVVVVARGCVPGRGTFHPRTLAERVRLVSRYQSNLVCAWFLRSWQAHRRTYPLVSQSPAVLVVFVPFIFVPVSFIVVEDVRLVSQRGGEGNVSASKGTPNLLILQVVGLPIEGQ